MKTDQQLQQDVNAELRWEPAVHAAGIGVEVKDGVVTLAGHVTSYAEKWHAERTAQRVAGVKAMVSAVKVQLAGSSQRSDAEIASAVENVLAWTSSLPAGAVQVMVEAGWVTLTGHVAWQFQKQAAADGIRHLRGVVGVSDQVSLQPQASAVVVKADIEAALRRTAVADAKAITVAVKGHDVTLSGQVHNWSERETATHAAWATAGVHSVVDQMTLVY